MEIAERRHEACLIPFKICIDAVVYVQSSWAVVASVTVMWLEAATSISMTLAAAGKVALAVEVDSILSGEVILAVTESMASAAASAMTVA